jgi:outer membrane receptor for ferrienterochelin and colicins
LNAQNHGFFSNIVSSLLSGRFFPPVAIAALLVLTSLSLCRAETDGDTQTPSDLTELSVEQLMNVEVATVYGASKYEQKVTDAPSSVSIITADEIKKYGYRTLADVLRSVRGFFVTYDRNYAYVGVRGFNRPGDLNTRVLLLVDGHRINDNIYESAPIGTEFPLDVDLIERIEVIRGPGSSLYGTNAFFGVINVITRNGADLHGVELSSAAGSFDTYNGRITYGNDFSNGLEMLLSGSIMNSKGQDRLFFQEFATTNNGIAERADGDKNYQFFSKMTFQDFIMTGVYASREKGIPTASYGTVFDTSSTRTTDAHGYLDLKYAHQFTGQTDVTARVYYDHSYYHGDYLYAPAVFTKDLGWGDWWGAEAQVTRTFLERHKLTAGVEYRDNIRQDQKTYDVAPYALYLDDKRHSNIWAAYLQDEVQLLKDLTLTAGVRYDHYDTFGGTVNPRAGLIYKPLEGTIFKLLYGEAFRAPSAYEFYYNDGGVSSEPSPNLKPEKIRTYELVYEQYLGDHFRTSLSGFYYRIDDLISQQVDPANDLLQFRNTGNADAKGVEMELEGKWASGFQGRLSYTFQDTKDGQTGKILSNSPQHMVKMNLIAPLISEKLFIGIEEQYISGRSTPEGDHAIAFFITNLTLFSQKLLPGLELSGSVYNLFDTHYGDPVGAELLPIKIVQQDGRTFRVKLTYNF